MTLSSLYRNWFVATTWNIGIVRSPDIARLINEGHVGRVDWCRQPATLGGRADPILWPLKHGARVIYEELNDVTQQADIRSIPLEEFSGSGRSARVEIKRPFHLSYPFILELDRRWYCLPESARSNGLDLYAWDEQTQRWSPERRLIDGVPVLDGTLFNYDGLWYLFGMIRGQGSCDMLRIWWSETLAGPWHMHAMNPAKHDEGNARPAGPLFEHRGRWYRPAQDCTGGYGKAVVINRIEMLTPHAFSETPMSRLQPDPRGPYPDGLHQLVVSEDIVLIDGQRTGFVASRPLVKIARRWTRAGQKMPQAAGEATDS